MKRAIILGVLLGVVVFLLFSCNVREELEDALTEDSWIEDVLPVDDDNEMIDKVRAMYILQWIDWVGREDMTEYERVLVNEDELRDVVDEIWSIYIHYGDDSIPTWEESESTLSRGFGSCADENILRHMIMVRMGLEEYSKIVCYVTSEGAHAECAVNFDGEWKVKVNGVWVDKPAVFIMEFNRWGYWFN